MSKSSGSKGSLPSWMTSTEEGNDDGEQGNQIRKNKVNRKKGQEEFDSDNAGFSRLMEGVVFVLSGFVNPERSDLRSKMLEMGSEYQPDWNAHCTLLVCAFDNTPKFRQVEGDGGTIISKDWILECYKQRKLVDLEPYILHAGKPWRRQSVSRGFKDKKPSKPTKDLKERMGPPSKKVARPAQDNSISFGITPSKAKRWAMEDFVRTISWLESQEEKPEPSDIKAVAAEGILTCIQDTIDALRAGQGVQQIAEQWACVPRVVEELSCFNRNMKDTSSTNRETLCREAMACKAIYEFELLVQHDDSMMKKGHQRSREESTREKSKEIVAQEETSYDSDATVEMTEEEIDQPYKSIASSL